MPESPSPARGVIAGQVVRPPGTDPRSGTTSTSPVPVNGDPIDVHGPAGKVIATVVTKPGGLFSVALPAGEYRLVEGICGVSTRVSVKSGSTTHLTIQIPNTC